MKSELLIFGCQNFNNSIEEIKDNLGYSSLFFDFSNPSSNIPQSISGILVEGKILNIKENLNIVNNFKNKPIILLQDINTNILNNFDNKILLPVSLSELRNKIRNIITASEFVSNSSLKIKEYILNKNEKKLTKLNISISLTEREIQLIELLFKEKKSFPKNLILQKIWKYSNNADTHTVETHIYRLRKKINDKFGDDNFILNSDKGYYI